MAAQLAGRPDRTGRAPSCPAAPPIKGRRPDSRPRCSTPWTARPPRPGARTRSSPAGGPGAGPGRDPGQWGGTECAVRACRGKIAGSTRFRCRRHRHGLPATAIWPGWPVPSGRRSCAAGTLVGGTCCQAGMDWALTEDPRKTRRNGSKPCTAQSRSARSGEGSSRHVLPGCVCAPAAPGVNGAGRRGTARPPPSAITVTPPHRNLSG
jgi:hypothetical protein